MLSLLNLHKSINDPKKEVLRIDSKKPNNVKLITVKSPEGKIYTCAELGKVYGMTAGCVRNRVNSNWPWEKLIEPKARNNQHFINTPKGFITIKEAEELSGIPASCLEARERAGWVKGDMFLPSGTKRPSANPNKGYLVAEVECPNCKAIFTRKKGNTQAALCKKGTVTCCSKGCSYEFRAQSLSEEERKIISESSLMRVYRLFKDNA